MIKDDLVYILETMGAAHRKNRDRCAQIVLDNGNLFKDLIDLTFNTDYEYHHRAAWTLELVLEDNLDLLLEYVDFYTANLYKIKNDSALRSISKINKWIAIELVKKKNPIYTKVLSNTHIERIIEAGFDWLISNVAVASQAYTMATLYYLGQLKMPETDWVHAELKNIITHNISTGKPAYKAQGKKILKLLQ